MARGRAFSSPSLTDPEADHQRLDKWLVYARVVKTRGLAAELVESGHVRLNGHKQKNPAKYLRPGDVLTIALHHTVRVLRLKAAGARRGPACEAQMLYEDLTAPAPHLAVEHAQTV